MPKITKEKPKANSKPAKKMPQTKASILSRIHPVRLSDKGMKMCLYGRSGTGKTTVACTFPKKLLIIGAEDGTQSVYNVKGVDFIELKAAHELQTLLAEDITKLYKTIVLDSATSLQDLVLKEVLGLDELPAQLGWGIAKQQDWGTVALQMKEYLRALLNLSDDGTHVVVIAQERNFNDDGVDPDVIMPYVGAALTPSVTGWLNPACDYIGQTFIRQEVEEKEVEMAGVKKTLRQKTNEVEYCLRTAPHEAFMTKFRSPKGNKLPDVLIDPDYRKIQKIIGG